MSLRLKLPPHAKLLQFSSRQSGPVCICSGAGRTRMQNASNLRWAIWKNFCGPLECKIANTNQPFWFQCARDFPQMPIACGEERHSFRRWQFVRRAIASAAFHEGERAIVQNEMRSEKFFAVPKRSAKSFQRRWPLISVRATIKSQDWDVSGVNVLVSGSALEFQANPARRRFHRTEFLSAPFRMDRGSCQEKQRAFFRAHIFSNKLHARPRRNRADCKCA